MLFVSFLRGFQVLLVPRLEVLSEETRKLEEVLSLVPAAYVFFFEDDKKVHFPPFYPFIPPCADLFLTLPHSLSPLFVLSIDICALACCVIAMGHFPFFGLACLQWKLYCRRATVTANYSDKLPLAQGVKFSLE